MHFSSKKNAILSQLLYCSTAVCACLEVVSPGKQLFCWGWQELCAAGGEEKWNASPCTSTQKWENSPQRISVLLLSSQKIRLQLDRPLWISVASPTHFTEQRDWNDVERHKFTKIPEVSPPHCWVQRCTCRKQKLDINGPPACLLGSVGRRQQMDRNTLKTAVCFFTTQTTWSTF